MMGGRTSRPYLKANNGCDRIHGLATYMKKVRGRKEAKERKRKRRRRGGRSRGGLFGIGQGGGERNRNGLGSKHGDLRRQRKGRRGRRPQRVHHRRFPSDQEGPLGDQHRPTEQALGHRN